MYFRYFVIISPWKRVGPFIWIKLNPLHPRMHCDKFGWNWPSGSGEEFFFNFVNVFLLFRNYLPLEKSGALHLNKLSSPSPKDALCLVWLKLAQWFWRRFFNFVNVFSLFHNYFLLEKSGALHLNKLAPPSPKDALCQVEDFLILSMYFRYFLVIISPWKRAGPFFWTNLNPLFPRMLCAKFCWNWPMAKWFWRRFLKVVFIFIISQLSPLWKGRGPSFE